MQAGDVLGPMLARAVLQRAAAPPAEPSRHALPAGMLQREIAPGQPLPDIEKVGKERMTKGILTQDPARLTAGFPAALTKLAADERAVAEVLEQRRTAITDITRQIRARQYVGNEQGLEQAIEEAVRQEVPDAPGTLLARQFVSQAVETHDGLTKEAARQLVRDSGLGRAVKALADALIETASKSSEGAARRDAGEQAGQEWATRWARGNDTDYAPLSSRRRAAFARALRTLPALVRLAQIHTSTGDERRELLKLPENCSVWRGGGYLFDDVVEVSADDKGRPIKPGQRYRAPLDDDRFKRTLFEADKMLRLLIEPAILRQIDRPRVHAHLMRAGAFRAFMDRAGVHFAANEPLDVIVHEVGHWVEEHGGVQTWADIRRLIHGRHVAAGGRETATIGPLGIMKEGRFSGSYGATGWYTSKAYGDGSSEMMSMTLEFLSNPKKFDRMIDKDPVQAALILRGLRPTEYGNCDALRDFDGYLPS